MTTKTFLLLSKQEELIGQGYILPSGMVALYHGRTSKCIYPSMDAFIALQKLMERKIEEHLSGEFYLQRDEDVTGISGNGIVARGCDFGRVAVIQWCTPFGSINWFDDIDDILKLHGHNGKTKLIFCNSLVKIKA